MLPGFSGFYARFSEITFGTEVAPIYMLWLLYMCARLRVWPLREHRLKGT